MSTTGERDVSPYDRLQWPIPVLESFLASGSHRRELTGYFGERDYHRLAGLARQQQKLNTLRGDTPLPRVYVLPGILGSQLGRDRKPPLPADLLWIDPIDVIAGALTALRLPDGEALHPLGVIAYTYMGLKLRLGVAGFDVRLFDYDWRQDVVQLGMTLADAIAADPAPRISIVAHSLGGLVARVAMAQLAARGAGARIHRLITLGTPHLGSFAALQALRGSYPVVRRLAALDVHHNAEQLSAHVFATFPSLYQMIPFPPLTPWIDLYDGSLWPVGGLAPQPALLANAARMEAALAPLDERCLCIAGIGEPTVTRAWILDDEFSYQVERHGDGTVPIASAAPEGVRRWYVPCEHGDLARNQRVGLACGELLVRGDTGRLGRRQPPHPRRKLRLGDAELADAYPLRVDWQQLSSEERVAYFNQLNLPPPHYRQLTSTRK